MFVNGTQNIDKDSFIYTNKCTENAAESENQTRNNSSMIVCSVVAMTMTRL